MKTVSIHYTIHYVGGGGIINTRNSTSFIRLSIYNDGVWPVEMKRRLEVEEKRVCSVYIWLSYQIDLVTLYIGRQTYSVSLIYFQL